MLESIKNLVIGNMEEKRSYKRTMKRVNALPEDYRFAFRKILKHMFATGLMDEQATVITDLVDLLETSAAEGKQVIDVIGNDAAAFAEELASVSVTYHKRQREKLNKKIMENFNKEEQ